MRFFLFSLLLLWSAYTFSQVEQKTVPKPHLYKFEKDGNTSFLLGTMHAGIHADEYDEFQAIAYLLELTPQFANELGPLSTMEARYDLLRPIEKYDYKLTEKAEKLLKDAGLDSIIGVVNYYELQTYLLYSILLKENETFQEYNSLDGQLTSIAEEYGKIPIELDKTSREILRKQAIEESKDEVIDSIACHFNYDEISSLVQDTKNSFKSGDLDVFSQVLKIEETDTEDDVQRNKNWIPILEEAHQNGGVFATFGAAHLIGDYGVVELLKTKGYKVEKIINKEEAFTEAYKLLINWVEDDAQKQAKELGWEKPFTSEQNEDLLNHINEIKFSFLEQTRSELTEEQFSSFVLKLEKKDPYIEFYKQRIVPTADFSTIIDDLEILLKDNGGN